jgi:hypothetical protein
MTDLDSSGEANPFVSQGKPKKLIETILTAFFCLVKLPFFMLAFSMASIYTFLAGFFPIHRIRVFIVKNYSRILFRVCLFLLGIVSSNRQPTALIDTYSDLQEIDDPGPGDVILANCASYLNLFWLQAEYSPIFAIAVDEDHVSPKSFFQLFFQILSRVDLRIGRKMPLTKLIEIAKSRHSCPVVLFPEAAATNGRCLLTFRPFGRGVNALETKFHIYGFLHWEGPVSPNFVSGNAFWHFMSMLGRVFSGLRVKVALPQDIPKSQSGVIDGNFVERARFVMARILGVPTVDVSADDFTGGRPREAKPHTD